MYQMLNAGDFETRVSDFHKKVKALCADIQHFRARFSQQKDFFFKETDDEPLKKHFQYVDEFVSNTIHYYLTGLLPDIRNKDIQGLETSDNMLSRQIVQEKEHRKKLASEPEDIEQDSEYAEFVFYRAGLLKKFVMDALLLNTSRSTAEGRLRPLVGSLAAGVAMLVYFVLFIWQGQVFVINSEPFVIATVILYILKDRLKESLKTVSYNLAFKWFADYTTTIQSPYSHNRLGKLKESFSFVSTEALPDDIIKVRNKEFHYVLEDFPRPESVILHKKKIIMDKQSSSRFPRRHSLNIIFRFNILRFLTKADNPYQSYMTIKSDTHDLDILRLPKVYHVNIIMKNAFVKEDGTLQEELKKFRLILDKNGIKRVEHVA